ncbi:MAG TPA: hypothetical protein DCQ98_05155 [Planctomycetaceae bacterium]|nr:hypothetical protein [Planctomycetaceae bacterium]
MRPPSVASSRRSATALGRIVSSSCDRSRSRRHVVVRPPSVAAYFECSSLGVAPALPEPRRCDVDADQASVSCARPASHGRASGTTRAHTSGRRNLHEALARFDSSPAISFAQVAATVAIGMTPSVSASVDARPGLDPARRRAKSG